MVSYEVNDNKGQGETKQFDTNQPFTIKTYKATVEEIIEHFKDK